LAFVIIPALLSVAWAASPASAVATCDGKPATIVGTNGDETITGTPDPDVIVGKGGRDTIKGLGGRDRICGGTGDDRIVGGGAGDRLFGGSGYDVLRGGAGNDVLIGFDDLDALYGNGGDDALRGGTGVDWLYGEGGNDNLFGEAADDHLFGGDGSDGLDGGPGSDECRQGSGVGISDIDCEDADLGVTVSGPSTATAGQDIPFKIHVHNHGPDTASYEVRPTYSWSNADCTFATFGYLQPPLAAGDEKVIDATMNCQITGASPNASVAAEVDVHGVDPNPGNDTDSSGPTPIDSAP
jgi:hypothetical protein